MTQPHVPGGTSPFAPPTPQEDPQPLLKLQPDSVVLQKPPEPQEDPQPILKGTFAIYITPGQAIVLAYRPEGTEETKQMVVPPFVIGLAARQSGQDPEDLIKQLREGF